MRAAENVEVWYVAHPVGAPTPAAVRENLARAKRWLRWLVEHQPEIAFCVPWLPLVEVLDDEDPTERARGLRDDVAIALRCNGIVLCGGRVSTGMRTELDSVAGAGGDVADLTRLGDEPPTDWDGYLAANEWEGATPIEVGVAWWEAP